MPFELQPVLKGELLELRPLRADDFDPLFAVASDPLIWEQHPARDRYREDVFREFFREALQSGGALIALDARDGGVIGSSRFHGYDEEKRQVEIGWTFLARSHWGGRFNREMKQLMLRHAFRFVERVVFLVGVRNLRSRRAVEKIGGVLRETRRDVGGREIVVYEIGAATSASTTGGRDLRAALAVWLPDAIAWATDEAARGAAIGKPLLPRAVDAARRVGVTRPEEIRVLVVDALPLPKEPVLRDAALRAGLLGPGSIGLTLDHSIFICEGNLTGDVLSHECRHVYQYESHGGITGFLPAYLGQILDFGYRAAPLEVDAREHAIEDIGAGAELVQRE